MTTYCDVNTCEDCPRYADDCDGDKRVEHTDLISRADAIRWVKTECNPYGKPTLDYDSGLKVIEHLKKMPSELPPDEFITDVSTAVYELNVDGR